MIAAQGEQDCEFFAGFGIEPPPVVDPLGRILVLLALPDQE
jgi:hypothetical protein